LSHSKQSNPHVNFVNLESNTPWAHVNNPTTILDPWSTYVKQKWSNVFSPKVEVVNNNIKVIVNDMKHMNVTHLEIEKHCI
jgi:hypothetical protein